MYKELNTTQKYNKYIQNSRYVWNISFESIVTLKFGKPKRIFIKSNDKICLKIIR